MKFQIENGVLRKYTEDWSERGAEVVIPEGVTSIADEAFSRTGIKSVTLPEGLISIGKDAFYYCDSLQSIRFPKSIKSIGESAFSSCRKLGEVHAADLDSWLNISFENDWSNPLTGGRECKLYIGGKLIEELSIPEGIDIIKSYAFSHCNSLTSVIIPDGVVELGKDAFYSCDNLAEITLPGTLRRVGMFALNSHNLKRIHIKSIEAWLQISFSIEENNYPFDVSYSRESWRDYSLCINGEQIEHLVIPQDVREIDDIRFQGLTCLKEVVLPEGLASIGKNAFAGCHNLQSIIIPDTVTHINQSAFAACLSLKEVRLPKGLTCLNDGLFSGCKEIETIDIPSSVSEIGCRVFSGCGNLRAINIPRGVKKIGGEAFKSTGITGIELPEGIEEIEAGTFTMCHSLDYIRLPNSLKKIGREAFWACQKNMTVYIKNMQTWMHIAFEGYDSNPLGGMFGARSGGDLIVNEKKITSLELITTSQINDYTFFGCAGFVELTIPDGIKDIGVCAFAGCPNLKKVILPDSIQTISDNAFTKCNELEEVILPSSLTQIGENAFSGCSKLKLIEIPKSTKTICKAAFYKSGLTKVVIPEGTEAIEESAFSQCEQLEEVSIPATISKVGATVFTQCPALKKVSIGCSFTAISKDAFSKCSSIKDVIILEDQFEVARDYFLKKVKFYTIDGLKLGKPEKKADSTSRKTSTVKASNKSEGKKSQGKINMETKVVYPEGSLVAPVTDVIQYSKGAPKGFVKPTIKEAIVMMDGKEFISVFKIASKLPSIWKKYYIRKDDGGIYDPRTALKAVQQSSGFIDDSTGSYVSCPLYGQIPESTQSLKPDDIESRLKTFVLIANRCVEEKTLLQIARSLPKKKNGMLYKGRLLHIAYLDLVDYDGSTFEIVAKNEDDEQFCVEIRNNVPVVSDLFYQSYLL